MIIALLLNSKLRATGFFRGVMLIPWTIPSVVVAILWRWVLHQDFGVINYLAYVLGITEQMNLSWQVSNSLAMASVVIASRMETASLYDGDAAGRQPCKA